MCSKAEKAEKLILTKTETNIMIIPNEEIVPNDSYFNVFPIILVCSYTSTVRNHTL